MVRCAVIRFCELSILLARHKVYKGKRMTSQTMHIKTPLHNNIMTLALALRCVAVGSVLAVYCERSNVPPQHRYATERSPPQG